MNAEAGGLSGAGQTNGTNNTGAKPKASTVQTILGEHSNLVNLDDLVTSGKQPGNNTSAVGVTTKKW